MADTTTVGIAGVTFDRPPDTDAQTRERVWARVQLARNVRRPHTLELLGMMAEEVIELHGDRLYSDDAALVGGFATLGGQRVVFVGHQKGADVDENIRRNFGMPHPDGYRKAMRLMRLAERLGLPIVTFVDTPGASPDAASEERGQAEAIAHSIAIMTTLRVPIVTVITGEGGSGGALAIAVGDVVLALENAIYSVISPEGCASILWRTPEAAQQAAVAMRLTAADQHALGVVDEVVPEPPEGAHHDPEQTARVLREVLVRHLDRLMEREPSDLVEARHRRYRRIGTVQVVGSPRRAPRSRKGVGDRIRELLAPTRPPRRDEEGGTSAAESRSPDARSAPDQQDGPSPPPLHEEIRPMRDMIQVERQDGSSVEADSLAQLARVADELLPPLVARLGVSDLGEIEVRQGSWRVRIRRAAAAHSGATTGQHPAASSAGSAPSPASSSAVAAVGAAHGGAAGSLGDQPVARSTAVGYFGLRPGLAVGHRVAKGDVLGWVDVLGVRMEIVAPSDGVIERFVTEPGDPVEYGQELIAILGTTGPGSGGAADATIDAAPD